MPLKYYKEMICDYMGAGRAYYGDEFTFEKEYEWWQGKKAKPLAMHEKDKAFIDNFFKYCQKYGEDAAFKRLKKF